MHTGLAHVTLTVPYRKGHVAGLIRRHGTVLKEEHTADGLVVEAQVPPAVLARLRESGLELRVS